MNPARLLLLEDDVTLHETLKEYLEEEGFEVVGAFDGESAQDLLFEQSFDLLILDVNVPRENGFALLRHARSHGIHAPALFITSRDAMEDVEEGFESGADDYLRKPFALKELFLRVQSMLRRRFSHPPDARIEIAQGVSYDMLAGTLYYHDEAVVLGNKQQRLLALLLQRRGEVVTHETIASHLWDFDETPSDDALRTYIKELRKIVGKERIISHKRTGYQFR